MRRPAFEYCPATTPPTIALTVFAMSLTEIPRSVARARSGVTTSSGVPSW